MKVTGIIAEYNPFHKGHAYQLSLAKKISDASVVLMSGSFVQRGDVAVFDKWKRAEVALANGADLVLELPVAFSMNTAERFAFGAVSILDNLQIVDFLMFGSECGDIKALFDAAKILDEEPEEISKKIKKLMGEGMGYALARQKAFEGIIDNDLISAPNNILGIEYIRQLLRRKSGITPKTHKREGASYHSENLKAYFPSATALRSAILENRICYEFFKDCDIHRLEKLDSAVIYNIRKNKRKAFENIADVGEGIENRIISSAEKINSIKQLEEKVLTKRYTASRIRRIILASLLGLETELSQKEPDYVRVLGANSIGIELLKNIKQNSKLKIITKTADFKENNKSFEADILATDIYDLTSDFPEGAGADFIRSPIILNS